MARRSVKTNKRLSPIFDNLQNTRMTVFIIGNGDLGALKKIEKSVNSMIGKGKLIVEYDNIAKIGAVRTEGISLKKKRQSKRAFELII